MLILCNENKSSEGFLHVLGLKKKKKERKDGWLLNRMYYFIWQIIILICIVNTFIEMSEYV